MADWYPPDDRRPEFMRSVSRWGEFGLWHVLQGGRPLEDGTGRYSRPFWRHATLCGASIPGRSPDLTITRPHENARQCRKCMRLLAEHESSGSTSGGDAA